MSIIDIRTQTATPTGLRFASVNTSQFQADVIEQSSDGVKIIDSNSRERHLRIRNKVDGENMVKAIQQAIALGWLK